MLGEQIQDDAETTKLFNAQAEQEEQIKKESECQALISDKVDISCLQEEYNETESAEFLRKAKELSTRFKFVRRVRGDGNCMYRALAFAKCERFIAHEKQGFDKFLELVSGWKSRLLNLGFPDMTTEDFCDVFVEVLKEVNAMASVSDLEAKFNDTGLEGYIVVFMRLVTSGFLQEQADRFQGFIEGPKTVKEYCQIEVDPMYRECDHLCITALTEGLDIPIRIEYMDQTQGFLHHDFTPGNASEPELFFLYRPGHYDILYHD